MRADQLNRALQTARAFTAATKALRNSKVDLDQAGFGDKLALEHFRGIDHGDYLDLCEAVGWAELMFSREGGLVDSPLLEKVRNERGALKAKKARQDAEDERLRKIVREVLAEATKGVV